MSDDHFERLPDKVLLYKDHPQTQNLTHAIISIRDAIWHIDQCKNGAEHVALEGLWRNINGSLRGALTLVDIGAQATSENFELDEDEDEEEDE